jgi:hypothetical protein
MNVVEFRNKTASKQEATMFTLGGEPGPLATQTRTSLLKFFNERTAHRPSVAMLTALMDAAMVFEAMADGRCPPSYFLSSLDPGVGKTQTVAHFLRAFTCSEAHQDVGAIICLSRLDEIDAYVTQVGLPEHKFAVLTSDEGLNRRGSAILSDAQVLFTTQQMLERRTRRGFCNATELHYRGRPRRVRIWDETILPGVPITVERFAIGGLLPALSATFPELARDLDRLFRELVSLLAV